MAKAKPSLVRFLPVAVMLAVIGVLGTALYSKEPPRHSKLVGKPLPVLDLPQLNSTMSLSSEDIAGKYVLINVFASWCSVCVIEHAFIQQVEQAYGIPVYGIAWRDAPEDTTAWLEKYGNPYHKVAMDEEGSYVIQLGVTGTPESFLIGPNGVVLAHYPGALDQAAFEAEFLPLVRPHQ